mgnify:CR=1 FL=1
MSYELKEEFLFRHEDGSYRGYDIYHFLFEGHEYKAEVNFRPDDINGGTEFETPNLDRFAAKQRGPSATGAGLRVLLGQRTDRTSAIRLEAMSLG